MMRIDGGDVCGGQVMKETFVVRDDPSTLKGQGYYWWGQGVSGASWWADARLDYQIDVKFWIFIIHRRRRR